ncbi:hypothetical protein GA0070623_4965 [Micromonospora rifamycinica]|uniref:Uncharacterized protein n=1 Tax=Micromonospora rifamycinica TaxID=291594 RepID=A0A1C5KBV9_9ACTN|nr:hypothetical protein GA0070623_4965 [Micromonospora rifamycinica]
MAEPTKRVSADNPDVAGPAPDPKRQRSRVSQEDVPSYSLEQALRVPRAIADNYAYKPTRPLSVAEAMRMTPSSGPFRMITGAAVAYGLTTGGAKAPEIGITPLGMRIVRPTSEGDDIAAMREALLRPKVVGEFLRMYDGGALPPEAIGKNVLKEKGVPADRVDGVLELIVEGAQTLGFLKEWGGKRYIDLTGSTATADQADAAEVGQTDVPQNDSVPVPPQRDPSEATRAAAGTAGGVSVAPGVHINIEIHIAADASSETIEEIFRNMRRYVLTGDGQADDVQRTR